MGSTSKTVVIDNLITSTWYAVRKEIMDMVYKITPFMTKLMDSGKIKSRIPDGTHFEVPIRYAKADQNMQYFTRGTLFGTAEKEVNTNLLYYARNLGTSIPRYWDDDRKNRGTAKILSYIDDIIENTKLSIVDKLETDLLNQSTDPNSINALPTIIANDPTTGSVGGQTRTSALTYLQNQYKDFTGLSTGTSLLDEMTRIYNLCGEYKGGSATRFPNLIITTRAIYQDYERICRALQQIVTNSTERVSLGFAELMFKNCEIFYSPSCPSGTMYFLNTDTIEFAYDPSAWFEMTEWKPMAGNSLDRIAQVVCVGNLICTHFPKNGVIFNITATTT